MLFQALSCLVKAIFFLVKFAGLMLLLAVNLVAQAVAVVTGLGLIALILLVVIVF